MLPFWGMKAWHQSRPEALWSSEMAPPEGLLRRPGDRAAVIGRGEVLRVVEAIELRTLFGSCRALFVTTMEIAWRMTAGCTLVCCRRKVRYSGSSILRASLKSKSLRPSTSCVIKSTDTLLYTLHHSG